jgi:hypothetical protein
MAFNNAFLSKKVNASPQACFTENKKENVILLDAHCLFACLKDAFRL